MEFLARAPKASCFNHVVSIQRTITVVPLEACSHTPVASRTISKSGRGPSAHATGHASSDSASPPLVPVRSGHLPFGRAFDEAKGSRSVPDAGGDLHRRGALRHAEKQCRRACRIDRFFHYLVPFFSAHAARAARTPELPTIVLGDNISNTSLFYKSSVKNS